MNILNFKYSITYRIKRLNEINLYYLIRHLFKFIIKE
nr:MAG TPA: hypothetical protein [Caudoviricetes sp.]